MPATHAQTSAVLLCVIHCSWRAQVIRGAAVHLRGGGWNWSKAKDPAYVVPEVVVVVVFEHCIIPAHAAVARFCISPLGCTRYFSVLLWLCAAGAFHTDKENLMEVFITYLTITYKPELWLYSSSEGSADLIKQSPLMIAWCAAFHNKLLILHFLIVLSVLFAVFVVNSTSVLQRLFFTAGRLYNDACCHVKRLYWQRCHCSHCCQAETQTRSFIKQRRWTLIIWFTQLCFSYGQLSLWLWLSEPG